jgi:hypothetical protein
VVEVRHFDLPVQALMPPADIGHVLKCLNRAEQTMMCDDTFQCLWQTLAFLFILMAPPLLLFWIWSRLLT